MKDELCEICEGEMKYQRVPARFRFKGETIYIENVPAWVCKQCGEQYFDAPVYKQMEKIAQHRERIQKVISGSTGIEGVDKLRRRLKPTPGILNPFKRVSDASRQFQLVASTT